MRQQRLAAQARKLATLLGLGEIGDLDAFLLSHGWTLFPRDAFSTRDEWVPAFSRVEWKTVDAVERQLETMAADLLKSAGWSVCGSIGHYPDGRDALYCVADVHGRAKGDKWQSLAAGLRTHLARTGQAT